MNLLIGALRSEAPDWLVEHLKIHFTSDFEGARNKLIEFEPLQDNSGVDEVNRSKKKGRLLHMTTMLDAVLDRELHEHNQQVEQLSVMANRVARDFNRDKFWIAPEIFREIKPETKEDILRVKRELLAKKRSQFEQEKTPMQNTDKPPLPTQYGKAQQVTTRATAISTTDDSHSCDEDDTDPSNDEDLAALARAMNLQKYNKHKIFMTTTVRDDKVTVQAHTKYYGAVNHNKTSTGDTIVIADSGADTTMLDDIGSY